MKKNKKEKNTTNKKYYCESYKCKTCKFRTNPREVYCCNYFFITGTLRGCDPGDNCIVYEKGDILPIEKSPIYVYKKG